LKLGENSKFVKFTGSPSMDEIRLGNFENKRFLEHKYNINLNETNFLLVYHPVTTQFSESELEIKNILEELCKFKQKIIAIYPNSDAGNKNIFKQIKLFSKNFPFLTFFPNIPRQDYLGLLKNKVILVGNSSSGIIEASYFGTPVVNIGKRQDGREKSNNIIDCLNTKSSIKNSINYAIKLKNKNLIYTKLYGNGYASNKIIKLIENIKLDKKLIQKQISY
jgi:UDP-hydrolysing UDP-N-acetyl-D-glucosamine 2-epimerase